MFHPSSDTTIVVANSSETGLEGTNLTEAICAIILAAPGNIMTDIIINFELIPLTAGQCYTRVSMVDFVILVHFYDHNYDNYELSCDNYELCASDCNFQFNCSVFPLPQTPVTM